VAARTQDAAEFASGLSDRWLACRELGHTWKPLTVTWASKENVYDRQLRCPSCRTVRRQVLSRQGHVLRNSYIYPDGYLAKGLESGTYSRDLFRLEAVVRYVSTHDQRKAS
jgi:hypothetical protein